MAFIKVILGALLGLGFCGCLRGLGGGFAGPPAPAPPLFSVLEKNKTIFLGVFFYLYYFLWDSNCFQLYVDGFFGGVFFLARGAEIFFVF